MIKKTFIFFSFIVFLFNVYPAVKLEKKRLNEIMTFLSGDKMISLSVPLEKRSEWDNLLKIPDFLKLIKTAEKDKDIPAVKLSDELYFIFSKTGSREEWEYANNKRLKKLTNFYFAECLENKGRFIKPIEEIIKIYCEQTTWTRPAHDKNLDNFYQKVTDIDLESSAIGWQFALIYQTFSGKLNPEIKNLLKKNIKERILNPFSNMVNGSTKENWWFYTTNNWNAVCLAGVVGSALIIAEAPEEKAFFIAAAEVLIKNFLSGFNKDGYCTEGVGYWNYGFGHFIMLSELLYKATSGKIDLIASTEARLPAEYGAKIEIVPGVIPAFADCSVNDCPDRFYLKYLSRKLGIGIPIYKEKELNFTSGRIFEVIFNNFYASNDHIGKEALNNENALRSWFPDTGLLISRAKNDLKRSLSFAVKSGNNDEHHNHNDISSFVVVSNENVVLTDPGAEVYTARTFSSKRYESKVLSSYGHPVPKVGTALQKTGKNAYGKILSVDFNDIEDRVVFDIKSAYGNVFLKKLEREFIYSRKDTGLLTVIDRVEFSAPENYESALITFGGFEVLNKDTILVYDNMGLLKVKIDAEGYDYEIKPEIIDENLRIKRKPTRIGIQFKNKIINLNLKLVIEPVFPDTEELLLNGGFEYKTLGWDIKTGGLGEISSEKAFSGKYSLKITDESETKGSNIYSLGSVISENTEYVLKGKYFTKTGTGLGIYVYFYDGDNALLNIADKNGNYEAVGKFKGSDGQWKDFMLNFITPKEAKTVKIWLHSINSSKVTVFLDDLKILKK